MKNYIGVISLAVIELVSSLLILKGFEPATFFALWALCYLYLQFRLIFRNIGYGMMSMGHVGKDDSWKIQTIKAEINEHERKNKENAEMAHVRKMKIIFYTILLVINAGLSAGLIFLF